MLNLNVREPCSNISYIYLQNDPHQITDFAKYIFDIFLPTKHLLRSRMLTYSHQIS